MQFQYLQTIHALPQHWKESINNFAKNLNKLYIQDHPLIKCNTIYSLEKLNTKEFYHMQYEDNRAALFWAAHYNNRTDVIRLLLQ